MPSGCLLMLGIIWWMYAGYAWLTNAVAPSSTQRRTLLLTGMAGFMVIALSIPYAFDGDGWAFGVGYVIVTAVHSALFLQADDNASIGAAIAGLAPINGTAALLVLVGGFLDGPWHYGLWTAALVVVIAAPYLQRSMGTWTIDAATSRNGTAWSSSSPSASRSSPSAWPSPACTSSPSTLIVAMLGLCIAYYLYWNYFSGDETRAEHALHAITDPARKARVAVQAVGLRALLPDRRHRVHRSRGEAVGRARP